MKAVRRNIQMVFQDPYASLDPRMTRRRARRRAAGRSTASPAARELRDRVADLFRRVGLTPEQMRRHPHEFSGGQRQRICIARALALSPKIIVADESVSALDVSVQARVLDLLQELQDELGVAYLFISHDMAVVEQISHRVAVMYRGQIVEIGRRARSSRTRATPTRGGCSRRCRSPTPPSRRAPVAIDVRDIPSPLYRRGHAPVRKALREVDEGHFVIDG